MSWKKARKLIKEDPRYKKYSDSDHVCVLLLLNSAVVQCKYLLLKIMVVRVCIPNGKCVYHWEYILSQLTNNIIIINCTTGPKR